MDNCYVLRTPGGGLLCFYFDEDARAIVYKSYENNRWGRGTPLVTGARRQFTANMDENGAVYLFCQDMSGHILLCTNSTGKWEQKVILENKSNRIYTILMHTVMGEGGLCLIYNIPNPEDKTSFLVAQAYSERKSWSPAQRIDMFTAGRTRMYTLTRVSSGHALLFYQAQSQGRAPESSLGFREITASARGAFNVIHTPGYSVADTSFLTTGDAIHALYVVKGLFSSQLIYRAKRSERFDAPLVVWEAQAIDNCLLFFARGVLYAAYMSGGRLYCCASNDGGASFAKPFRYENKFCARPLKAAYISHEAQDENLFRCSQLYVDAASLWDVQLLPDLFEDFYPRAVAGAVAAASPPADAAPEVFARSAGEALGGHGLGGESDLKENMKERLFIVENQLALADRRNEEKREQVLRMNEMVKLKNAEIHELEQERRRLAERIATLEEAARQAGDERLPNPEEAIEMPEAEPEPEAAAQETTEAEAEETPATEAGAEEAQTEKETAADTEAFEGEL